MSELEQIEQRLTRLSNVLDKIGKRIDRRAERIRQNAPALINDIVNMDLFTSAERTISHNCKMEMNKLDTRKFQIMNNSNNIQDGMRNRNKLTIQLARLMKQSRSSIRNLNLPVDEMAKRIDQLSQSNSNNQLALRL